MFEEQQEVSVTRVVRVQERTEASEIREEAEGCPDGH